MKRGTIWLVNLDPTVGNEIRKRRLLKPVGTASKTTISAVLHTLQEMFAE